MGFAPSPEPETRLSSVDTRRPKAQPKSAERWQPPLGTQRYLTARFYATTSNLHVKYLYAYSYHSNV